MATEAQVVANRANAQKSTGPRTPEGKTVVAQNAVKHGLLARAAVLQGEDWEEYTCYHEEMFEELYPDGMQETELAARIVDLSWRLRRAGRYQNAVFEALYDQHAAAPAESAARPDAGASVPSDPVLGRMLLADFSGDRILERVLLYERRIESSLYRARAELRQLRRQPLTSAKRGPASCDGPWEDSGGHRYASPFASADFTLETANPAPPVIPDPGRDADPERDLSRLGSHAHATESLEGGSTNVPEAQEPARQTKPICAGPGEDQVPCGENVEEVGRGRPTHEEPPEGVSTNVADAQEQWCETNPIADPPKTEVPAKPVGSVPVRAYGPVSSLKCEVPSGQGRASSLPRPPASNFTLPTSDQPPVAVGTNRAGAEGRSCETNPISPGQQMCGSLVPEVGVAPNHPQSRRP